MIDTHKSIDESIEQLDYLVDLLSHCYDVRYGQSDLDNLGEALDALIHAKNKLVTQKQIQDKATKEKLTQLTDTVRGNK